MVNGKVYIGQSKNMNKRKNKHFTLLRRNKHNNKHLQSAWNKYSEKNFVFEIIESFESYYPDTINEREIFWIKYYNSFNKDFGYNNTSGGDGIKNYKHTEEAKKKIGEASKKRKLSKEHKEALLKSITGRKKSEEELKKLSNAAKGRKISEWHKQQLRKGWEAYEITDEVRKKISESRKGFKMSEEQKQKLSRINKGKPSNNKKLSDEDIENIKQIFEKDKKASVVEIAKQYNVSCSSIYGIRQKCGIKGRQK